VKVGAVHDDVNIALVISFSLSEPAGVVFA
jgi:hypothetical protein